MPVTVCRGARALFQGRFLSIRLSDNTLTRLGIKFLIAGACVMAVSAVLFLLFIGPAMRRSESYAAAERYLVENGLAGSSDDCRTRGIQDKDPYRDLRRNIGKARRRMEGRFMHGGRTHRERTGARNDS